MDLRLYYICGSTVRLTTKQNGLSYAVDKKTTKQNGLSYAVDKKKGELAYGNQNGE